MRPLSWGIGNDDGSYVGVGAGSEEYENGYGDGGVGGEGGLAGKSLLTTPGFRGDPFADRYDAGGTRGEEEEEEDLGYRGGGGGGGGGRYGS